MLVYFFSRQDHFVLLTSKYSQKFSSKILADDV